MSFVRSGGPLPTSGGGGGGGGSGTGPNGMLDISQAPYNCVPDSGTTDNGPGFRQAVADSIASNRPVWVPPPSNTSRGSYAMKTATGTATSGATGGTVVALPLDLGATQQLRVEGVSGASRFLMSNGMTTLFGGTLPAGVLTSTLRNITLKGFIVDANSIAGTGGDAILLDSRTTVSYDNIEVTDVVGINAPDSRGGHFRRWMNLNTQRPDFYGSKYGLTTTTRIKLRRLDLTGGTSGILITAANTDATPTGDLASGSKVISNVSDFDRVIVGHAIKATAGGGLIPSNATVDLIDPVAGTITMSVAATGTQATVALTVPMNMANVSAQDFLTHPGTPMAYHFFDDIFFEEVKWKAIANDQGTGGLRNNLGSGIQMVSQGWGGRIVLDKCSVEGSGDVGYEIQPVMDLTFNECIAKDCHNSGWFQSVNHGGMPWPHQQVNRWFGCSGLRTNPWVTPFTVFQGTALHGGEFGDLIYEDCTSAQLIEDNAAAANPMFDIRGPFRKVAIRNYKCDMDYTVTQGLGQTNKHSIRISHNGSSGILEIDGSNMDLRGSNTSGNTGATFRVNNLFVSTTSRLDMRVNGLTTRTDFDKGAAPYNRRDVELAMYPTIATVEEAFQDPYGWYLGRVLDAGGPNDVLQGSGQLTSIANHTTRKLWRWSDAGNTAAGTNNGAASTMQIGRVLDGGWAISGTTPSAWSGGGLAWELITRLAVDRDGITALRARVFDDQSANTVWVLEKVAGDGTVSTLFGPANVLNAGGRLTTGSSVTLRSIKRGDTVLLDFYTRAFTKTGDTTPLGVGDVTQVTYTLTGADSNNFGANSLPQMGGFGWTPGDSACVLTFLRHYRMGVLSNPVIDGVHFLGNRKPTSTNAELGLIVSAGLGSLRIDGKLRARNWHRRAARRDPWTVTPFDVSLVDPAMAAQIEFSESVLAWPPAAGPATVAVGAIGGAGNFYYQNLDMAAEDILATGGTLTQTAVTIASLTGGTLSGQPTVYGASTFAGLAPGLSISGTGIPGGTTVTGLVPSSTFVGNAAGGSGVITSVADTTALVVGQGVTGTGVPANAVITALTSSQVTVNKTVTAGTGVTFTGTQTVQLSANTTVTSSNQLVAFTSTMLAVVETTQDPTGATGWQPIQFSAGDLKHRLAAGGIIRWYGSGQPTVRKVPVGVG